MKIILFFISFLFLLCGCSFGPSKSSFVPTHGILYSKIKYPLTTSFYNVDISDFSNKAKTYAGGYSIFKLSFSESDLDKIFESNKLSHAYYADIETEYFLFGAFQKTTLNVYGNPN